MRLLIIMFGLFYALNAANHIEKADTVKFKIQIEKNNPLSGATILVKNSNPLIGTTTDMNGEAELIVKSKNTISVVNPVGPYIEFILPFLLKEFNHKILTLLFHYT
jgi:hypothetical protein